MVAEETEKEKEKMTEMEGTTNNKQNKKGNNSFSSFLLTVITGQNIAIRNTENNFDQNALNLDQNSQIPDPYRIGQFSNDFPREENEEKNKYLRINNIVEKNKTLNSKGEDTTTTSKSYTLTEEVQRVLIEDFFPPISSSTVPGNPGRLFITLSTEKN
jgi:hypothetical protein